MIYLAGADPYEGDRLGYLSLTKPGLAQRDRFIMQTCHQANLPLAVSMAGGYCPEVEHIADIHANTVQLAANFFHPRLERERTRQI